MNSTGEGDRSSWYDELGTRRDTEGKPCLEKLDLALIPSALGKVDDSIWWEYGAFEQPSELDQSTAMLNRAKARQVYLDSGALNELATEKSLANTVIEEGIFTGYDDSLDEIPETERYPSLAAPDDTDTDPSELQAGKGGDPSLAGRGAKEAPRRRAVNDARFNDASPRTLYVSRKLLNGAEFIKWAKGQGFETALPADELHVTIAYSRQPLDWMQIDAEDWNQDKDGTITIPPGGIRLIEKLGPEGKSIVLMFGSSRLSWRHEQIIRAGASWDWPEYQPHITITNGGAEGLDLDAIEPFRGELRFGPELFSEVDEDWKEGVTEK
jgi:hypothetical protein